MADANFNIPPMMNPELDKLPGAPAVRRRFNANPDNASEFFPEDLIQIPLPTGNASTMIDPSRSYLRFDIVNNYSGALTTLPTDAAAFDIYLGSCPPGLVQGVGALFWLDPSIGALNLLREFRVYDSGVPIEEMINYDNINTVIHETEFGDAIEKGLALQMWGAGGDYNPNFGGSGLGSTLNFKTRRQAPYPLNDDEDIRYTHIYKPLQKDKIGTDIGTGAESDWNALTITTQPPQLPFFSTPTSQLNISDTLYTSDEDGEIGYNCVTGGRVTQPYWERNLCVPSKADIDSWKLGSQLTGTYLTGTALQTLQMADKANSANYVTVCVPITSGIIGIQATKYLPSMLIASQSFKLDIKLGDLYGSIGTPLNLTPSLFYGYNSEGRLQIRNMHHATWGATLKQNLDTSNWSLKNVSFVGEEIILTPELTDNLFSTAARHPIRWTSISYRDYQITDQFTSGEDINNKIIPSNLQSVSKLMHTWRLSNTLTSLFYRRNFRVNPSITSWQYQFGAELYPQRALQQDNIPDMYVHPYAQGHSSESAIEFNKMQHKMTGQRTNNVKGFSDNTSWNANLSSRQFQALAPIFPTNENRQAPIFPLNTTDTLFELDTYNTTTQFQLVADFSRQSLLGSYVLGWDLDVFGGIRGDTRDGRSFQNDQINVQYTSGIGSLGKDTTLQIKSQLNTNGSDILAQSPSYANTTCNHNIIAQYDMVITINPEGTMEVAF